VWVAALFALYCLVPVEGVGVDVSALVSTSTWRCLKDNGHHFAIVRCWESVGHPDPNCPHTIKNAHEAGINDTDIYMFPCPHCGDPKGQVSKTVHFLKSNGVKYKTYWFDIEGPQYWMASTSANRAFMEAMLEEAKAQGVKIGIYTSASQWEPIMGSWEGGKEHPLWYAHYDDKKSFSDFSPFGGWTKPHMKQYRGDAKVCGADVDLNWLP
jgi:GH25 family lysozyme M1 (1,4-beta-N-acetylmuramidase)